MLYFKNKYFLNLFVKKTILKTNKCKDKCEMDRPYIINNTRTL